MPPVVVFTSPWDHDVSHNAGEWRTVRNGCPDLVPYVWRRGEAERCVEVDAKVRELRALAVSRMAAMDTGSGTNGHGSSHG